jgi:hypothetical protein
MTDLARKAPPGARFADPDNDDYSLLFDLTGETLPSGATAKVRPWNGAAERSLMASLQSDGPAKVDNLIRFLLHCVTELDGVAPTEEALLDLPSTDVQALQIRIRCVTHEDTTAVWKWDCVPPAVPKGAACGHRGSIGSASGVLPNAKAVDLTKLEFVAIPERKSIPLPRCGKTASFHGPSLRREKAYLAAHNRGRGNEQGIDIDALFISRGLQLDGKPAKRVDLEKLEGKDRAELWRAILRRGGINNRAESDCNGCGYRLQAQLEQIPGFFFPGMEE